MMQILGRRGNMKKRLVLEFGNQRNFSFPGNQSTRLVESIAEDLSLFPISFRSVTFLHVFAKNFLGRFRATNDLHRLRTSPYNPELIYIQNSTFPRIPVNADAVTRQNAVVQGCLAFVSRQLSSGIRGGKKKHRLITARRS